MRDSLKAEGTITGPVSGSSLHMKDILAQLTDYVMLFKMLGLANLL